MENTNREKFGSKVGVVAAAAGSAVGLGNIYRFPIVAGNNGGGAFLLIYLLILYYMRNGIKINHIILVEGTLAAVAVVAEVVLLMMLM